MRRFPWMLCALLVACQPQPADESPTPRPVPEPAAARWPPVPYDGNDPHTWRVQPGDSRVDLVVRRAGPLARFGHDHVLSTTAVEGWIKWNPGEPESARGDLRVAVTGLDVDPPEARRRHDVAGDPSPADVEGTRENLQREVLLAEQWPHVLVQLDSPERTGDRWRVAADLVLNGEPARYPVSVSVETGERNLRARGQFTVAQSRHGIEPFSVLGGSLSVADEVTVQFDIQARPPP